MVKDENGDLPVISHIVLNRHLSAITCMWG